MRLLPRLSRKESRRRKLRLKDKDWRQRQRKLGSLLNRLNKRLKDSVMKRKRPLVLQPKQKPNVYNMRKRRPRELESKKKMKELDLRRRPR